MNKEGHRKLSSVSAPALVAGASFLVYLGFLLSACGGNITSPSPTPLLPTIIPTETFFSPPPIALTPTPACRDGLSFLEDLTIPDSTVVSPGSSLDKQWLVQNSGSCNWDNRYRLRLVDGDALGASPEQALFPARAGMQATLRILFTAPMDTGEYVSEWQAFDPSGVPFGESFFIKIVVQ